jgi:hypothetical protein
MKSATPWVVGALVFAVAATLGIAHLYVSHPAEDAFILFKYAENVAHGYGIVYYPGGPRTEGATDFLWMMLLAASVVAGADVAVAAALWNALGAGIAAVVVEREIERADLPAAWRSLLLVVPLSLPFVAGATAAYLGFSSLLYQAAVLVAFVMTAADSPRFASWVPWTGLAITLFRPDGAFFAAAFVIATGGRVLRSSRWRPFVASTAAAAAAGIVYFVARASYFGELLPLPLHVKSHGVLRGPLADRIRHYLPWLNGIGVQLMWLRTTIGPMTLSMSFVGLVLLPPPLGGTSREFWRRAGIAAFGSALFLAALSLAFQVQNVHFRYQAPVLLLTLFVVGGLASNRIAERSGIGRRAIVFVILLAGLLPTVAGGVAAFTEAARSRSYIDVLPARLAEALRPGRTIALTDAGRLAYWTRTPVFDIAGLNFAPTALRPPSVALLREIDPDVVLVHPGAAIVAQEFPPPGGSPSFWEIDGATIERRISPDYRAVYDGGLARYTTTSNTATIAAVVMLRYLAERDADYVIESVRYQGGYRHVFAFRRALPEAEAIREALVGATSGNAYAPYAALKGLPLARRFDAVVDGSQL